MKIDTIYITIYKQLNTKRKGEAYEKEVSSNFGSGNGPDHGRMRRSVIFRRVWKCRKRGKHGYERRSIRENG